MQDEYTKYIIQSRRLGSKCDKWYTHTYMHIADTLEEAKSLVEFHRDLYDGTYEEAREFRIVKRDYETIDTVIDK